MGASKFVPRAGQREGGGYRCTTYIGVRNGWGEDSPFGLSRSDRRHHLYMIGKTGAGKTTLLRNLIIDGDCAAPRSAHT